MRKSPLIVKKLLADARSAAAGSRRASVGTTAQLREHLASIETLRSEGVTFAAIAEALAKQGITQGKDGELKPITASRLTALYSQMKRTDAKRAASRHARADAVPAANAPNEGIHTRKPAITLAPELTSQASSDNEHNAEGLQNEEALRRENRQRSQRFVKTPKS